MTPPFKKCDIVIDRRMRNAFSLRCYDRQEDEERKSGSTERDTLVVQALPSQL